ncbi:Alpha-(1,6)-fucosyltransferase [Sparganum proliferum]
MRRHFIVTPSIGAAKLFVVFWLTLGFTQQGQSASSTVISKALNPLLQGYHANEGANVSSHKHFPTKPLTSYDVTLRQTISMTRELWRLVDSQLTTYADEFHLKEQDRVRVHRYIGHATLLLESRLRAMDEVTGLAEIRRKKLQVLGERLQRQLADLQNPPDCSRARLLIVRFTAPDCDFLCQVRHVTLALSVGLVLKRTVVLGDNAGMGKREQNQDWVDLFLPLSKCTSSDGGGENMVLESNTPLDPNIAPPALPSDWVDLLADLHGNPYAWFRGQMLVYLWRYRDNSKRQKLETRIEQLRRTAEQKASNVTSFRPPLAGLDVRQLPPLTLSTNYTLQLERFFEYKHMEYQVKTDLREDPWEKPGARRVFLTTDDPNLPSRLRADHPEYEVITGGPAAHTLEDWVNEVFLLANTEFLVCSLRSSVCRLAYELMQADNALNGDASLQVHSVDTLYSNEGDQPRWWSLVNNFDSAGLKMGDAVMVDGLNVEGFLKVLHAGDSDGDKFLPSFMLQEEVIRIPK